jgi:hypothetical protein
VIAVAYPSYEFKIRQQGASQQIFDVVRKRWVALTPEEWVRQNMLQYLLQVMAYPSSWVAVEKSIIVNQQQRRCDILVYQHNQPWLIVECKAMDVALDAHVLQQAVQYNTALAVPYIVITNGSYTYGWQLQPSVEILVALPPYGK